MRASAWIGSNSGSFVTSCASQTPSRMPASCTLMLPVREHRDRERRLRGGHEQLLALHRVDRQAVQPARRDREHDRQRADEQRPLVHLRRHERAEPGVGVESPREHARDEQLGRLRRERRDQRDQHEVVDRELAAGVDERFRERLRAHEDRDRSRRREQHARPRCAVARSASSRSCCAGPTRCGVAGRRARDPHHVDDEDRDEDHRVDQRERAVQRQREPVDRRDQQERDRDAVAAVELDLVRLRDRRARSAASRPRRDWRMRYAPTSTTSDQPAPISSWLPPVMFASASGANSAGFLPAFHVKTKSTAYSGSTATSASSARASPAEMSTCDGLGGPGEHEGGADDREPEDAPPRSPARDGRRRGAREPRATPPRRPGRRRSPGAGRGASGRRPSGSLRVRPGHRAHAPSDPVRRWPSRIT